MSNKTLQLTPSRDAPVSYDRSVFPFTSFLELVRPFGVAELGVRAFIHSMRHKSTLVDRCLMIWQIIEQAFGNKYPSGPLIFWHKYYFPELFKKAPLSKPIKDTLKMTVIARMFQPSQHPNSHQYTDLISMIHNDPDPTLVQTGIQIAKIHYGILHSSDPEVSKLEIKMEKGLK
jgi:hypothetical protein